MSMKKITRILNIMLLILLSGMVSIAFAQKKDKKPDSSVLIEEKDENAVDIDNDDAAGSDTDKKKTGKKKTPETKKGTGEASKADDGGDTLDDETKGARFKFKGQVKNLFTFHETDNYIDWNPLAPDHRNLVADLTRVRLSPEFNYRDIVNIRVDYDNELIASNYGNSMYFKGYWRPSQYNDFLHLAWEPYRGSEVYYRTKIHRAYVKVSVDYFTATIGRQQIRFGSGKLWNPLDILNPISPTFIEGGDDQKGTDAIKLDFFPDDKTEISFVYDLKKSNNKIGHFNMKDCNYILRAKTSIKDTDIAILGGYVSRRGVAGFDFAAILFDGMLRGSVMVNQAGGTYYPKEDRRYWLRYLLTGRTSRTPSTSRPMSGMNTPSRRGSISSQNTSTTSGP